MATLLKVFQVENTQKWFIIPFFWGHLGIVQLAQGHPGWLLFQEVEWGIKLPTSGFAIRYLNH